MQFISIEGLASHDSQQTQLYWQYIAIRALIWPERFSATEPNKYDLYPNTSFYYMTDGSGRVLGGSRLITRLPGSGLSLPFEDASPYALKTTDAKPGIADHLDTGSLICSEMSALVVHQDLRHTGARIGGKIQDMWFATMKLATPTQPDLLIGRVLPANLNGLSRAADARGFSSIIRTDRISISKIYNHPVTTFLASCKDIPLAPEEMHLDGRALKASVYAKQHHGHGVS